MKVIAKKVFHKQTLYHFADENMSFGLFPIDGLHSAPARLEPELVYKKGDFKEWKFEVQEYCCSPMKKSEQAERITFQNPIYLEHRDGKSEEIPRFLIQSVGVFITCACWPIQLMQMHYCHFCGEKIEIEEKK